MTCSPRTRSAAPPIPLVSPPSWQGWPGSSSGSRCARLRRACRRCARPRRRMAGWRWTGCAPGPGGSSSATARRVACVWAAPAGADIPDSMSLDTLPGDLAAAATALLAALTGEQRDLAALPFSDDAARRWLEYRPEARPGACIAGLSGPARKAAHVLLATALSEHAFAQAMTIIGLEEVLDRREGGRRGRHSGDYWVAVFGEPGGADPWSLRF